MARDPEVSGAPDVSGVQESDLSDLQKYPEDAVTREYEASRRMG